MGKGTGQRWAETKRRQHAEKENDVSRCSKEDCSSPKAEMGESKGCPEEVSIIRHLDSQWENFRQQC